jgi:hypothetical protein
METLRWTAGRGGTQENIVDRPRNGVSGSGPWCVLNQTTVRELVEYSSFFFFFSFFEYSSHIKDTVKAETRF